MKEFMNRSIWGVLALIGVAIFGTCKDSYIELQQNKYPATLTYQSYILKNYNNSKDNIFIISLFNPSDESITNTDITEQITVSSYRFIEFDDDLSTLKHKIKYIEENSNKALEIKPDISKIISKYEEQRIDNNLIVLKFSKIDFNKIVSLENSEREIKYSITLSNGDEIKPGGGLVFAFRGEDKPRIEGSINNKIIKKYEDKRGYGFYIAVYGIISLVYLLLYILLSKDEEGKIKLSSFKFSDLFTFYVFFTLFIISLILHINQRVFEYKEPEEFKLENMLYKTYF